MLDFGNFGLLFKKKGSSNPSGSALTGCRAALKEQNKHVYVVVCVCVMVVKHYLLYLVIACICGCVVVKVTISSCIVRAGVAAYKSSCCPAQ